MALSRSIVSLGLVSISWFAPASSSAAAKTCAGATPDATWSGYLEAKRSSDSPGALHCLSRQAQVATATERTVAIGMAVATLGLVSSHTPAEGAEDLASTLRSELDAVFSRHGLSEVMEGAGEALAELAWEGDPELIDEATERRISAAVAKTDPGELIADLQRFATRHLAAAMPAEEEGSPASPAPVPELQSVQVQDDLAHGTAGGERIRFRRIDGLWYLDSLPVYW